MERRIVEAMSLPYCPTCGSPLPPADRFCSTCGTANFPAPGYAPYPPVLLPPRQDRTLMIVLIVVVLVIAGTIGGSIFLYVMVSGLIQGPPTPIAVGIVVAKSPDGTNWTLTFTSVPTNFNPSVATLSLETASAGSALLETALTSLTGGMVTLSNGLGSLYIRYSGTPGTMVSPGDFIAIGTMTSLGASTTGYQARILFAASIVFSGTLQ